MMHCFYAYKSKISTVLLLFWNLIISNGNHIKGLDDSILFRINWPGNDESLLEYPGHETFEMTTVNNEKFQCLVPLNYGESTGKEQPYVGPNALELLMPLFKKKVCTLRLEAFWTYELCHGQWIKQYHEGREENGQRYQEYSLGVTDTESLEKQAKELDEFLKENPNHEVPEAKLEGVPMPYFAVNYSDGTICDLTGNPRVTRVLYMCYEEGRHSVYSIQETYTCEYEMIVLSSFLCQHPSYRPQEVPQTNLHCIAQQEGTKRPKNLIHLEAESLKLRTHGTLVSLGGDITKGSVRIEVVDEDEEPEILSDFEGRETRSSPFPPQPSIDRKLVEDFLNGDYCLQGGSGWWKYELCHGKLVQQFHEDRDGSKYSITLGHFDLDGHKTWLKEHPTKRFREGSTQVSHFYSGGDYCDATAKPRQVEVRLKCKEALNLQDRIASSPSSVTLYLLEPKTCEYVLGVETPLICSLLQTADEFGLFFRSDRMENDLKNTNKLDADSQKVGSVFSVPIVIEIPPHTEPGDIEMSSQDKQESKATTEKDEVAAESIIDEINDSTEEKNNK